MEPEFRGPWWKHPYFVFMALTVAAFAFLLLFAWVGLELDLIPKR